MDRQSAFTVSGAISAIGALGFALAANLAGQIEAAFWFVAAAMLVSGLVLLIWGEETRPH